MATQIIKGKDDKGQDVTVTIETTVVQPPPPDPDPDPEPDPDPDPTPDPGGSMLPYTADSFYKSRVDGPSVPIDAALTSQMHQFMATNEEQRAVNYPKINLNEGWSGHSCVHRKGDPNPIWKLVGATAGDIGGRTDVFRTKGIHIRDDVWSTVPTGTQDRLLVLQDHEFGYTFQGADVAVVDKAARTFRASNAAIFWHSSNGLDHRNPKSNDQRNISSRGRVIDAMQVPREELERAIAAGTGVGHVMHLFWVRTHQPHGFSHPMVNEESEVGGWGGEGWRLRIKPSVNLATKGLAPGPLALARTLQQNGAYIGDNSGSTTQLKVGHPKDYPASMGLTTDAFKGKIAWTDFEVVKPGWQ